MMKNNGCDFAGAPLFSVMPPRGGHCHNYYYGPPPLSRQRTAEESVIEGAPLDDIEKLPLSRLALHTRGAILIQDSPTSVSPESPASSPPDSVCATSDDGGTGGDALPRIIKPRKRRKKDRKPICPPSTSPPSSTPSTGIVTLKPYLPMCPGIGGNGGCGCSQCQVFPTPPPSPGEQQSSSEEEEPMLPPPPPQSNKNNDRSLVRSLSDPPAPRIHIWHTFTTWFTPPPPIHSSLQNLQDPNNKAAVGKGSETKIIFIFY